MVTMAFGDKQESILDITEDKMKRYCERIKIDFIKLKNRKYIKDENGRSITPFMEKFQLYDILEEYDNAIWVDSDVVIRNNSENILDYIKEDCFNAVYDTKSNTPCYNKEIDLIQKYLGDIGWKIGYFNSGVFSVNKHMKDLFTNPGERNDTKHISHDQTLINYRLVKNGYKFNKLDSKWNKIGSNCPLSKCNFFHAAGPEKWLKFKMISEEKDYDSDWKKYSLTDDDKIAIKNKILESF